jgi:DNA-binding NtrC family response regulator
VAATVEGDVTAPEDRSPYEAVTAIIRTLATHSEKLRNEAEVLREILEFKGPRWHEYLGTVARAHHSIFYNQLQELYDFATERVPARVRDDFCFLAGQSFTEQIFGESFYPLFQVALARPGAFQSTIIEMIRAYLRRYSGDKYELHADARPDEIVFTFGYRDLGRIQGYLVQYGLDPARCRKNSLSFIAGAIEGFVSRLIADYDSAGFRLELGEETGRLRVPIRESDRFAYDKLIRILIGHIQELEQRKRSEVEDERLESRLILGSSLMREKWELIQKAGRSDELILLRGESGTGKSFMARRIHELSNRRDQPFVEVALTSDVGSDNLIQSDLFGHEKGAFTGATEQKQGLFSLANGGTLFLDEIGDASPELQAKLLRVVETSTFRRLGGLREIKVDVRLIMATNRDLETMVEQRAFRNDLYYRINVIPVRMPALRERREDVAALAEFLLIRAQTPEGDLKRARRALAPGLRERLADYAWPGNIRELDHALKYAVALADGPEIGLEDLPDSVRDGLRSTPACPPVAAPSDRSPGLVDIESLRRSIRASNPVELGTSDGPERFPAHISWAKRTWLSVLIDELHGDLSLIAQFWDRSSEKTLRNLIRELGLGEELALAHARARARK